MEISRTTWNDSDFDLLTNSRKMKLPNGHFLNFTDHYGPWASLNLTRDTVVMDDYWANVESASVNFTAIFSRTEDGPRCYQPDANTLAVECSIYWCVQTFNASMKSSILREHAHPPRRMFPSAIKNMQITSLYYDEASASYGVGFSIAYAMQSFLAYEIFRNGNSTRSEMGDYDSSTDMIRLLRAASVQSGVKGISRSLETLTRTMTTNVRTSPYTDTTGPPVIGTMQQQVRFIHVRWPWLILQIGLDVLAIVFLLGVIVQTLRTKTEVWKSSQVAMIFRGLNTRDLMDVETTGRLVDMEYNAQRVYVKLKGSDLDRDDKRLVKVA